MLTKLKIWWNLRQILHLKRCEQEHMASAAFHLVQADEARRQAASLLCDVILMEQRR